jgi:predicted dehydrogenase
MSIESPLRWGILGAARIADTSVIPALRASSNGRVMALASRSPERAAEMAARHAIPHVFSAYEDMLASSEIDAVYIPAIAAEHVDLTRMVLLAGKHVLCEKPIAMTAGEVGSLIALRDRTGLVCGEAFMIAHHPQWAFVANEIARGTIGTLTRVEGCFTYGTFDPKALELKLRAGGSALRDVGIYPVGASQLVHPAEAEEILASVRMETELGTDSFVDACIRFPEYDFNFYCGAQIGRRQHMLFHGDEGWIEVRSPFTPGQYGVPDIAVRRAGQHSIQTERIGEGFDQYRLMVENFAEACQARAPLRFSLEQTLANHRILDAILAQGSQLSSHS